MFDLAGKRDPAEAQEFDDDIPLPVLALPEQMAVPAYLLDRTWTARAWNAAAAISSLAGWTRRLTVICCASSFFRPRRRCLIADWEERGRRVVAEFRADYSRCLHDPAMRGLIDELSEQSPVFLRHWKEQAVLGREGGERQFNREGDRPLRFYQNSFALVSHPEIKLVTLAPLDE